MDKQKALEHEARAITPEALLNEARSMLKTAHVAPDGGHDMLVALATHVVGYCERVLKIETEKPGRTVPVLYEVDTATNEAMGTVHPFCSTECRDAFRSPGLPDWARLAPGDDDALVPDTHCEHCGAVVVR